MAKTEKYNLQRLLEMRARARDEAALYLAECRRLLALAEDELANRKKSVEDCRREQIEMRKTLAGKSRGGIKSSEIVRFRQYLTDLREKELQLQKVVEDQKSIIAREEKKVEKALNDLTEAAKELKVIEKHRENWRSDIKKKAERREQKSNDETGAILHERQKFE
ncbi:MAG TPA: flagellar FliJ family protein [Pyrinomonadaceae bacterium]|jgi:flagellar export protein FliJ